MSADMNRSWLVQRLEKPRTSGLFKNNPFAFGGGLKNGGLSDEAFGLVAQIMAFDYMGAAEFEFGALPKALQRIAEASHAKPRKSKLTAFDITVPLAEVPPNWQAKKAAAPGGEATIYILCQKDHADEVNTRIRAWAAGDERLKESTRLTNTLRPFHEWDGDTVGWLELDNGFFFFTDREMWQQTCSLFGVDAAATVGGAA